MSDHQTSRPAGASQKQRFGEELAHQLGSAGAHRGANSELFPAFRGARQQQVGGVGHGDEQNQTGRKHENVQSGAIFVAEFTVALVAVLQNEFLLMEAGGIGDRLV